MKELKPSIISGLAIFLLGIISLGIRELGSTLLFVPGLLFGFALIRNKDEISKFRKIVFVVISTLTYLLVILLFAYLLDGNWVPKKHGIVFSFFLSSLFGGAVLLFIYRIVLQDRINIVLSYFLLLPLSVLTSLPAIMDGLYKITNSSGKLGTIIEVSSISIWQIGFTFIIYPIWKAQTNE